ncbi:MAG: hypothetical protein HXX11_13935 [Desulfuromonadales bacterium]|nr:hypothetical protein [Desulfuromonadales bacterium]
MKSVIDNSMPQIAGLKFCFPAVGGWILGGRIVICVVSAVMIGIMAIDMFKLLKKN